MTILFPEVWLRAAFRPILDGEHGKGSVLQFLSTHGKVRVLKVRDV